MMMLIFRLNTTNKEKMYLFYKYVFCYYVDCLLYRIDKVIYRKRRPNYLFEKELNYLFKKDVKSFYGDDRGFEKKLKLFEKELEVTVMV